MGNRQCSEIQAESLRKSPAYGQFQHTVEKDYEFAIVTKSVSRNITSREELLSQLQKRKQIKSVNIGILECTQSVYHPLSFEKNSSSLICGYSISMSL